MFTHKRFLNPNTVVSVFKDDMQIFKFYLRSLLQILSTKQIPYSKVEHTEETGDMCVQVYLK